MTDVAQLLAEGRQQLADSEDGMADAQSLLSHVLQKSRAWLFAWPEHPVDPHAADHYRQLLQQRQAGQPIAYLLGYKAFWTFDLLVNEHTLIPRPETELLVEKVLQLFPAEQSVSVLDLGTGSGAIALAIASERPHWQVLGSELNPATLTIAKANHERYPFTNLAFQQSDWFGSISGRFDLIVSNPPYIATHDPHLNQGDLRYEPLGALSSGTAGLDAITHITQQAAAYLQPGAWLVLEHGFEQGPDCRQLLWQAGLQEAFTDLDLAGLDRISGARLPP